MLKELKMKYILVIFLCIFQNACNQQKKEIVAISSEFNFEMLFKKSKNIDNLKMKQKKNQDYFKGNLSGCNSYFYKGVIRSKMYYLANDKNDIVVQEYIFDNIDVAKNAFKEVQIYADFTRNLKRKDFGQRCYEIGDEQIYYSALKTNHIYLLTSVSNFNYVDGNTSVDDIFKFNKDFLLDDLYRNLIQ